MKQNNMTIKDLNSINLLINSVSSLTKEQKSELRTESILTFLSGIIITDNEDDNNENIGD